MDMKSLKKHRAEILAIAASCKVKKIEVFGSVARGDATEESDVDFLVEMLPHSGFGIGGLKWRLEELLRCKVDVVPESGLNPLLRNDVLREARSL